MEPLNKLIDFFPTEYRAEISFILDFLENERIATTIEELSVLNPESLGGIIHNSRENKFLTDMYVTTIHEGSGGSKVEQVFRSEERRVGKECRTRWWAYH